MQTLAVLDGAERATAIFAADNDMTLGVMTAIRNSGLRAPEDISILAFDDLDWATVVQPALSVVAQPCTNWVPSPPSACWLGLAVMSRNRGRCC